MMKHSAFRVSKVEEFLAVLPGSLTFSKPQFIVNKYSVFHRAVREMK